MSISFARRLICSLVTISLALILALAPWIFAASKAAELEDRQNSVFEELVPSGKSAVLLERDSLRVLYEKNGHDKMPMASTTKVMTALVAIERGNLDDIVTVSARAYGLEGSSIYLGLGEKARLGDLLYGLMLQSGNDAAVAIAEHVGGSLEGFVGMMNERAQELGAFNTSFMNPHGLPADGHYTTAYDLALISAYAMRNTTFREIAGTKQKRIPWGDRGYDRILNNKNKLLYRYDDATGIKTGFTKAAGRCLAFSAERDGMEVVGAVLSCGNYFDDSEELMEAAFAAYDMIVAFGRGEIIREISVVGGESDFAGITVLDNLDGPVLAGEDVRVEIVVDIERVFAPVEPGRQVGNATMYVGETVLSSQPLITASNIERAGFLKSLQRTLINWPLLSKLPPPK